MVQTIRYAITDLSGSASGEGADAVIVSLPERSGAREERRRRLLTDLGRWAADGVDYVQLREKALRTDEVFALAVAAMGWLHGLGRAAEAAGRPRFLVNGRPDVAAAAGADGVHLTGRPGELGPDQVREVFGAAGLAACTVSISCHSLEEVAAARAQRADLILFSPVFEKHVGGTRVAGGAGLEGLRAACAAAGPVPVLALGGVGSGNLRACEEVGAAGVAGIRLFGGEAGAWSGGSPQQ